ncbi:MAG: aminotransferase class III-fold pyridoxal phosphate-dependent enzyme, partial [Cloacibacillus sp.]
AAALGLIKERGLCAHAADIGDFIKEEITKRNIPHITEVRAAGLLIGAETDVPSQPAVHALQMAGLLCLAAGPRVVRLLPSFSVTRETAFEAVNILENVFREMK